MGFGKDNNMEPVEKVMIKKVSAKVERVVLDNDVYTLLENRLNEFNGKSTNTKLNLKQHAYPHDWSQGFRDVI